MDIKTALELCDLPDHTLAIWFGSRSNTSDVDLLVISPDYVSHDQVRVGKIDLTLLSANLAVDMAINLDFLVCEPFLSGTILKSHPILSQKISKSIQLQKRTDVVKDYMFNRFLSVRFLAEQWRQSYLRRGLDPTAIIAVSNLGWAVSYFINFEFLSHTPIPTPLFVRDFLTHPHGQTLSAIREIERKMVTGKTKPTVDVLNDVFRCATEIFE